MTSTAWTQLIWGALAGVLACTALATIQPPWLWLWLAVAMGLVLWLSHRSALGPFSAFVVALACGPEVMLGVLPVRAEDVLLPVWLLGSWRRRTLRWVWDRTGTWLLAGWAAVAVLATARGLLQQTLDPWLTLCHSGKYLEYGLVAWLVMSTLRTRAEILQAAWWSVGVAAVAALVAGAAMDLVVVDRESRHVIEAWFPGESSNVLGGYWTYQLLLLVALAHERGVARPQRLLVLGGVIGLGYAIICTASRTSLAALCVGVVVLGALVNRWLWAVLGAAVVLAPWYLPPGVFYFVRLAVSELSGQAEWTWAMRLREWAVDWQYILQRPLLGHGLSLRPASPMTGASGPVDSEYLNIWLETGLVGLMLFAGLVVWAWTLARRVFHNQDSPSARWLAAGYQAGLAALLVHSITGTSFTAVRTAEVFWLTTGLLVAADRLGTSS